MIKTKGHSKTTSRLPSSEAAEDLMSRSVASCTSVQTLADAAKLMWEHDCGIVPVLDPIGGKLCGVVTDRDICMSAWTRSRTLAEIPVGEAMAQTVYSVHKSDPIQDVFRTMQQHQVRRIPVLDEQDALVGIISLNDLALHTKEVEGSAHQKECQQVAETVAEICQHRRPHLDETPSETPSRGRENVR